MSDLGFASACQLAQMIRDRTLSSVELLDAYLAQIAQHNGQLNAICTLNEEKARARAQEADEALIKGENWGALHGVPITIKDFFETAGLRTTAGYLPLKNYVPDQDATVVARLRAAGAILIGKTNPSDVNGTYQGINDIFPRVNNPWNVDYTTGGSSSGCAAAIAAGLSALDVGSDIAGSIRQPAHFCGIYGLKPTDRRVSLAGHILEVPGQPACIRQMLVPGPLARSVEDLRLCFELIAGPDPRQPDVPPVPAEPAEHRPLSELRIAWADDFRVPVAADIQKTLRTAIDELVTAGARVNNWAPAAFDWAAAQALYNQIAIYTFRYAQPLTPTAIGKSMRVLWRELTQGDPALRQLVNPLQAFKEFSSLSLRGYYEALTERDRFIAQLDQALAAWDAWLVPVAATPAFTHRADWSAIDIDGRSYPHSAANGAYTMPFNLTGHPAVVIPVGQTQTSLPIGLQIVGKRWREMELLAIAQQIDQVVGRFQRPPGY
ncbi:MAG: amidase [Leptolyngbya sp. SIO4C1]|nr:amidase [Leptolyngbya sp. SIO4C1]